MSGSPNTPNDATALAVANAAIDRLRAETEVVAAIAGSPRQGLALLAELRVTTGDIANLDVLAIFLAIRDAADAPGPVDRSSIATAARDLLVAVEAWDPTEERATVSGGMWWGPKSLARLLTVVPFDRDTVRTAAANLLDADRRQQAALDAVLPRKAVAA